jgi:CRISPR-associated protein Cmr5
MSEKHDKKRELTRDQKRALHAYECVRNVPKDERERKNYEILINDLGSRMLRSGLAATMAFIERDKSSETVTLFCKHIGSAGIPNLTKTDKGLFDEVRKLEVDDYMLATRELLKVVTWLKRAVQAEFKGDDKDGHK